MSTLALRSPTTRTAAPFMAGYSFKEGDVPAGSGVTVSGADAQATVKNLHPDGSVAFAILAGYADVSSAAPTTLTIGRGAASTGTALTLADLQASGATLTIQAVGYGTATWSGAGWAAATSSSNRREPWIAGHKMSSWVFAKPAGADAHLQLRAEVCLYANGEVEVFPYVENGWVMVAGPTNRQSQFIVTLNGVERFNGTVNVGHHTRTPLISGTAMSYWTVAEPRVAPKQARGHLVSTGRVVRPDPTAEFPVWTGGANTSFQPFQLGLFRNGMYGGGHYEGLGPQPGWEVAYLASDDPLAYESMVRQGWSWGRYGIHYRDENTGRPIAFADHPVTQISGQAEGSHHITELDTFFTLTYTPTPSGEMPAGGDYYAISHSPAPPYGAYLATGRHYLMEQCQFQATANFLAKGMSRNGVDGLVMYSQHQLRATAWMLRTLFLASVATPDDHPLKSEFSRSVKVNVDYLWNFVVAQPNNPFGTIPQYGSGTHLQTFQHDFLVGAWGLGLAAHAAGDAQTRTRMAQGFQYLAKGVVGRLGGTSPTEFLYRNQSGQQPDPDGPDGTAPVIRPSVDPNADFEGGTGPWRASWGEIYEDAIGYPNPGVLGGLQGGDYPDPHGYWGQMHFALDECARHNAAGVAEALARVRAADNFADLGNQAKAQRLLVCSRTTVAPAAADYTNFVPAAGTAMGIAVNSVPEVDPQGGVSPQFGFPAGYAHANSFLNSLGASWSWGVFVEANSAYPKGAFFGAGGGHGGQVAWISPWFDINSRSIGLTGWDQNVPPNGDWTGLPDFDTNSDALYNPANDLRDPVTHMYAYTKNGKTSLIGLMPHLYLMTSYAPPSAGAPKGHVIIGHVQRGQDPSGPLGASPANPWMMNVVDGVTVNGTTSEPLYSGNAGSMAFVPWARTNRTLIFLQQHPSYWWLDHSLAIPSALGTAPIQYEPGRPEIGVYYTQFLPVPDMNMILCWGKGQEGLPERNGMMGLNIIGMEDDVPLLTTVAIPPRSMPYNGIMCGGAWHKVKRKFYFYEGRNTNVLHVLTPSSLDFRTCTWTWSQETFGGIVPPGITKPSATTEDEFCDSLFSPGRAFGYVEQDNTLFYWGGHSSPVLCADGVTRVGSPVYITPA